MVAKLGPWGGAVPCPAVLAATALFAAVGAAAGPHRLYYKLMVASQDARFVAEGRLDGQLFLHYDSERGRAEPQGPLTEAVLGAETWETETKDLTEIGKELRVTLAQIIALQGQKGVSHSLQEERGCEISGGSSAMGFRHFYYDGEPFLSYNPKTWTWTVAQSSAQTLAVEVKKSWDTDGIQSKDYWARVHGELCRRLQRYLDSWVDLKERAVSPAVNVTPSKALEGRVTLSDVNGTYQSWVTTKIPQEEEQRFTGHVGHSGSHSTPPVPSGKASVLEKIWPAMVVVAAVAAAVAAAVIIYVCLCKKKTMSAAQGPASAAILRTPRKRPIVRPTLEVTNGTRAPAQEAPWEAPHMTGDGPEHTRASSVHCAAPQAPPPGAVS